jgi:hypothetical protein
MRQCGCKRRIEDAILRLQGRGKPDPLQLLHVGVPIGCKVIQYSVFSFFGIIYRENNGNEAVLGEKTTEKGYLYP